MHKILIVDDDRIIRKGLIQTIPWAKNGFHVTGEAGDGEEALAMIRKDPPQVVVSDIRMPFMDGLELAKHTKETYPDIKFIFLTGYEDFSYAKRAIDLQAVDYLLKPVERDILLEKAKQAAADWDKEQGSKKKLREAKPYLRSVLFQKILAGQESEEMILASAEEMGMSLHHQYFLAMILQIDDYTQEDIHPRAEHKQLRKIIAAHAEKILCQRDYGGVIALEHDTMVIIFAADIPDDMRKRAKAVAEAVCEWSRVEIKTTLTIALGTPKKGLLKLAESFDEAHSVLAFRHVIGKDTVITPDDLDKLVSQVQETPDEKDENLVEKVRLGLVDDAQQVLSEMEQALRGSVQSLGTVRMQSVDLMLALFKGAEEWAPEWSRQHVAKKTEYYSRINEMQTVSEIVDLLRGLVNSLAHYMTDENTRERTDVIDDVTDYIQKHYAEHGLSLQDIGRYVHMNPIYLSVLFKKKKKITFTGFLLQIRMTKAMEMLRSTDLKTYEVAEKTGYNSPEYFGACFKKYTGCSPLEFRNRS